jgi:hypothetical protein
MTTEPDDAMAWAIKQAEVNAGFGRAWHYKDVCHAYRAGHAARDAEVAALKAAITGWLEYLDSDDDDEPEQEHALLDAMRAALGSRT